MTDFEASDATRDRDGLDHEDDEDILDHSPRNRTATKHRDYIIPQDVDDHVDAKPSTTADLDRSLVRPIMGMKRKRRRESQKRIIEQEPPQDDEPLEKNAKYYDSRDEIPAPIVANDRYQARRKLSRDKGRHKTSHNDTEPVEVRHRKRDPDRESSGSSRVEADNKPRKRRRKRPKRPEAVDESYGDSDNDESEYNDKITPTSLDPTDGDHDGDPVAHVVEGTSYSGICEDDGNCQVTLKSNNPKLGKAIKSRDEPSIARHLNKWMGEEDENK